MLNAWNLRGRAAALLALSALFAFAAAHPNIAGASAAPRPDRERPGAEPPRLILSGHPQVEQANLRVRCDGIRRRARCRVELSFELVAAGRATLESELSVGDRLEVDGEPSRGPVQVGRGRRIRVRLRMRRTLRWTQRNRRYLVAEPMLVRHALLGQAQDVVREGDHAPGPTLAGDYVLRGGVRVRSHVAGRVRVQLDGVPLPRRAAFLRATWPRVSLVLPDAPPTPRFVRHGGPVLGLGANTDGLLFRLGYELGIGEWLFVQAGVETDFRTRSVTVVTLEAALPSPLYLVPSLSAGAGVAVRGGDRRAAALRLMVGASMMMGAGVNAIVDLYPRSKAVEIRLMGRLSL